MDEGLKKVFSNGSAILKEWETIGLLKRMCGRMYGKWFSRSTTEVLDVGTIKNEWQVFVRENVWDITEGTNL